MITVAESQEEKVAEELMNFFVETKNKECFAALLFTCYDLVKPDHVLEVAWRNGYIDFAMPYLIQIIKEYTSKVDHLVTVNTAREKAEAEKEAKNENIPIIAPGGPLLIQAPPGMLGGIGGPGIYQQQYYPQY